MALLIIIGKNQPELITTTHQYGFFVNLTDKRFLFFTQTFQITVN